MAKGDEVTRRGEMATRDEQGEHKHNGKTGRTRNWSRDLKTDLNTGLRRHRSRDLGWKAGLASLHAFQRAQTNLKTDKVLTSPLLK